MELFPPIEPYHTFSLQVSDLHSIFVEEAGNPDGKPVVFLHGGPGGGIDPVYRQYFDPALYHIILFDQRGCNRSTPHAELRENTTWDLVNDIEKIRLHLGIDRWLVFGGSWGSTLALVYAQSHPESVKGLILRGIFMLRQSELHWFYQEGANHIYPDAWEEFLAPIPLEERSNLIKAYYARLTGPDTDERQKAARAWSIWEGSTSKLLQSEAAIDRSGDTTYAEAFSRIECHYFINRGFFKTDDHILANIDKIRHIPAVIVQGRYDVVCPIISAWDLHRRWPEAEFHIVQDAGHSMTEPGIRSLLIEKTNQFAVL